jgi:hypothetical protein|tara:strand:- start:2602 stop:2901 length:300 start_codon:yes stop_codon:yes gene_type:complete
MALQHSPLWCLLEIEMTRNVLCLVVFGTLFLTGCDDSVTWLDQPRQSSKCDKEEIEAAKRHPDMTSILGKKICQDSRKGEFTGEIRCKSESFQVACKTN